MYDDDTLHSGRRGISLTTLAEHCQGLEGVAKSDLLPGDRVVVVTRNSVYSLSALGGSLFAVSGGWFSCFGGGEVVVGVNGCTFGGRAINDQLVAAPGLFLEFANGVCTTAIQEVQLVRGGALALLN